MLRYRNRSFLKAFASNTKGTYAVEAALLLPVFMFLVLGVVDMGQAITVKAQLSGAARMGTQYASLRRPVQGDTSAIQAAALSATTGQDVGLTTFPRQITVNMFCECSGGTSVACTNQCPVNELRNRFVTVIASQDYEPIMGLPGQTYPITLNGASTVQLQ
jgi:Flp pilus assembly protein TadG